MNLFFLTSLIVGFFATPSLVSAQVNIREAFLIRHPNATPFGRTLGDVFSLIVPNFIIVAGVFFIYLIIYGGYLLIIHGGRNNSTQLVQKGKNSITYGVLGFLLVVGSYFILQMISTITGIDFINLPI